MTKAEQDKRSFSGQGQRTLGYRTALLAGTALAVLVSGAAPAMAAEPAGASSSLTLARFGLSGPTSASTAATPTLPDAAYAAEYRRSWYLDAIGAADAYALGYTGKGVLVAVVDTGLDVPHPEFHGRVSPLSRSFAFGEDPSEVIDLRPDGRIAGHGTHVAGIIGAARDGVGTRGVAPEAEILALRAIEVLSSPLLVAPSNNALRYAAAQGAKVLNGSFGPRPLPPPTLPDPEDPNKSIPNPDYELVSFQPLFPQSVWNEYQAVKAAADADVVLVFSAGNGFYDQPIASRNPAGVGLFPYIRPENHGDGTYSFVVDGNLYDAKTWVHVDPEDPGLAPFDFSDLQGRLVTVVATDRNNRISSYSNRCGVAFLWCLAAPGGDFANEGESDDYTQILSSYPFSDYGAAVLRQAFPYLNAPQIIELMLTTTDVIGPREI